MPALLRVGVIGATGQGGYGHGLDRACVEVPGTSIVAVADHDQAAGRKKAAQLGLKTAYTDYRKMLADEKLDIVCIGPRWLTRRVEMVEAVAAAGDNRVAVIPEGPYVVPRYRPES